MWRYVPGWSPYHGLWGPGVHLLRNLSLQRKSLVVGSLVSVLVLTLLAQVVHTKLGEFQASTRAVSDTSRIRLLGELQQTVRDWGGGLLGANGSRKQNMQALADAEARAFARLQSAVAEVAPRNSRLGRLLEEVQQRRQALLAFESGAAAGGQRQAAVATTASASASAATGASPNPTGMAPAPAAAAAPNRWSSDAQLAARAYSDALLLLRSELRGEWATVVDGDARHRALREGLVEPASELTLRLSRLLQAELSLMREEVGNGARREAEDLRAEARTVLSLSRPMLERARGVLPGQSAQIDEQLAMIQRQLDESGRLLSRADLREGRVDDPDSGFPAGRAVTPGELEAFRARGMLAVQASRSLETLGLDALEVKLRQRRAEVGGNLLLQALGLGGMLLFTLYLLVSMYKVLAGGLKFLGSQVQELGRGNLSIRPSGHGRDEIGVALTTLGQSAAQMSALFTAVTQGVAAVSHASREVASGNASLNGRTSEIRESIGLVAARTQSFANAMEYCGTAVERVAEHVRIMRIEAQRGRKATQSLQARMRSLEGKSREITQVVALVEAVAHQTKLLALNASVEAARAGAQGKGFAVVAQEVRSLAGRSENAARRIRAIVDASVREIDEGSLTAKRVGETVSRSDREVESVNAIMGEIVGLMREGQSQARDVLDTAHDVDDAAGGNARTVQMLSEASAQLRDQGDSLKRSIQHFVTA